MLQCFSVSKDLIITFLILFQSSASPALLLAPELARPINSTIQVSNAWPPLPFRVPIFNDIYLNILNLPPWDPPVQKEDIEWSIIEIAHDIRISHTPSRFMPFQMMFSHNQGDIDVQLCFFAPDMRSITFYEAKEIANELYDLTNEYGPRQIAWANVEIGGAVASYMWLHFVRHMTVPNTQSRHSGTVY